MFLLWLAQIIIGHTCFWQKPAQGYKRAVDKEECEGEIVEKFSFHTIQFCWILILKGKKNIQICQLANQPPKWEKWTAWEFWQRWN